MLPLYKVPEAPAKSPNFNVGLWFERFYDQYNTDAKDFLDSKTVNGELTQGNNFWLQKFKRAGETEALNAAACRQMDLIKQLGGKHKFFNTQWHFVTGTGNPHPVENGLSWHPVHGVPYLSGAAVKGLVRAWVEAWAYPAPDDESEAEKTQREAKKRQHLLDWFGSDHKRPKDQLQATRTGDIIFFDALPVKEVQLKTDIMTPHYGDWYQDGGKINNIAGEPEKIPADWHDPVPIPFLVVDKASSFLFGVAPRNLEAAARVDINCVLCCLTNALEWLGAGAKTAGGYGGFDSQQVQHPLEKQWLAASQSLDEEIAALSEAKLIEAFSKDYNKTKTAYENKGQDWAQIVALVWAHHHETISAWADSDKPNTKKAYKKFIEDQGQP